jgi:predicted NBD/HSP70 family sugar kinase
VALTDLEAHILLQESFDYGIETSATDVLSEAAETIQRLIADAGHPEAKLVGIGVGVQGVIDYSTNTLVVSYNKKSWEGESLSVILERRFNVPVYVENDVKTMALGEYLLGAAKGTRNFVQIWVGIGLGAGIMINGHLLHGITSSAGEIGYNALESPEFYKEKFPLSYTGQAMFGEILTDANFIASYTRGLPRAGTADISVASIARKAMEGDATANQVIEEFTSLLSMLCINLVNTLNPEVILIGGKLAQQYPPMAGMLQETIHKDLLAAPAEAVRVLPARHGENGVILGAAGLVLYEMFEPLHTPSVRTVRRQKLVGLRETGAD